MKAVRSQQELTKQLQSKKHLLVKDELFEYKIEDDGIDIDCFEFKGEDSELSKELLVCIKCKNSYPDEHSYLEHILTHTNEIKCPVCRKKFNKYSKFEVHLSKHAAGKLYTCEVCQNNFTEPVMFVCHLLVHSLEVEIKVEKITDDIEKYDCSQCNRSFTQKKSLSSHMKRHKEKNGYECTCCNIKFDSKHLLKKHLKLHLNDTKEQEAVDFEVNNVIRDSSDEFNCQKCDEKFETQKLLTSHSKKHMALSDIKYQCAECGKSLKSKILLKRHLKKHDKDKPFKCTKCTKSFYRNDHFVDHMNRHDGNKANVCPYCNKGEQN